MALVLYVTKFEIFKPLTKWLYIGPLTGQQVQVGGVMRNVTKNQQKNVEMPKKNLQLKENSTRSQIKETIVSVRNSQ